MESIKTNKNKKKKVLIVSPCVNLPVPAVQGGAVSTLIEYLVKENEHQEKMDLTVLSIYNEKAVVKSEEYANSTFRFMVPNSVLDKLDGIIDLTIKVLKKQKSPHQYCRKEQSLAYIKKYLKENTFDRVVFQNSGYLLNVLKDKVISEKYEGKLYYHLHNDIPTNVYVPGVKQCTLLLISEYLKKKINIVCGQDMSEQCRIVKNGFDCGYFAQEMSQQEQQQLRTKLKIDKDKKIVMFAGRIDPTKGIVELTEAFKKLNRTDIVLMVVGAHNFGTGQTSEFQEKMMQQFAQLGEQVCFTGFVPYDEMWKYYKLADLAVLPSMWEEPAGLTMIEACAAGVPLITTKSGGIPEYIQEEYSIILNRGEKIIDDIKTSMELLIDNEEEWKKKARHAKENTIKHYSMKSYYDSFVKNIDCEIQ